MIRAVIVEDEKHSRETLKNLLSEFCEGVSVAGMAGSVDEACSLIPQKPGGEGRNSPPSKVRLPSFARWRELRRQPRS